MTQGQGKSIGKIAFEAYNAAKGGLTYDGKLIPGWDTLPSTENGVAVQAAWQAAAEATVAAIDGDAPERLIDLARRGVEAYPKSREAALVLTKLDEAAMWHASIPKAAR